MMRSWIPVMAAGLDRIRTADPLEEGKREPHWAEREAS